MKIADGDEPEWASNEHVSGGGFDSQGHFILSRASDSSVPSSLLTDVGSSAPPTASSLSSSQREDFNSSPSSSTPVSVLPYGDKADVFPGDVAPVPAQSRSSSITGSLVTPNAADLTWLNTSRAPG